MSSRPDVKTFQHQPITILYQDDNQKARKYTPDVFVEFETGKKMLFEIKYEEEILSKEKSMKNNGKQPEFGERNGILPFPFSRKFKFEHRDGLMYGLHWDLPNLQLRYLTFRN